MSSILKALKKLEDEKVTRKPDSLKIDAEILRSGSSSNLSSFKAVILSALLVACGAAATYLYMKNSPTVPVAPATGAPVATGIAAPPGPLAASPAPLAGVQTVRITPENIVPANAVSSKESSTVAPLKIAAKKTAQQATASGHAADQPHAPKPQTKLPSVQPVRKTGDEKPSQPLFTKQVSVAPVVPAASAGTQPPSIKVSGIAFQDGIDSVAMVNGIMASRGTVVEGVRVEKIQKDRVLFSYGAEKFEVMLGKSNK